MTKKLRNTQGELIAMKKQVFNQLIEKRIKRKQAAALLQMHPSAVSRLKKRYEEHGEAALMPQKPGPKKCTPRNRTSIDTEEKVANLAKQRSDLGPVPLSDEILEQFGIKIHPTTVWRILRRRKIRYTAEYKRWAKEEPKLYCLDTPGLELQMDGSYPFGRSRKIVHFDAIDDCSRWVYAKIYQHEDADSAIDFVKHLIKNVPFRIQRIRVDNRYGRKFVAFCDSIGITVIENDAYCPKQNGKIERFHKTVKREFYWKYCSFYDSEEQMGYKMYFWLNYYNTGRKHGGYGMNRMTPQLKIASTLFNSFTFNLSLGVIPKNVTLTMQQYSS